MRRVQRAARGPVSRRRSGPAPRPHARTAGGRRAGVRRRAAPPLDGLHRGLAGGPHPRSHARPGRFPTRPATVRPPPRGRLALAQRRRTGTRSGRPCRPRGGCPAQGLRQVHRRPGGDRQPADRGRAHRMRSQTAPLEGLRLPRGLSALQGRVIPHILRITSLDLGKRPQGPSRVYPVTTDKRPLKAASGCTPLKRRRGPEGPLTCCYCWWQVQGSNLRRLSRQFYSPVRKYVLTWASTHACLGLGTHGNDQARGTAGKSFNVIQ